MPSREWSAGEKKRAMNDQYYTREPESASRPVECAFAWRGKSLLTVAVAACAAVAAAQGVLLLAGA